MWSWTVNLYIYELIEDTMKERDNENLINLQIFMSWQYCASILLIVLIHVAIQAVYCRYM